MLIQLHKQLILSALYIKSSIQPATSAVFPLHARAAAGSHRHGLHARSAARCNVAGASIPSKAVDKDRIAKCSLSLSLCNLAYFSTHKYIKASL
jgi:hypothetical protein